MEASTQFQIQIVAALPTITHHLDQLDLAGTIERFVPWEGEVPLGTLVEVLIANCLLRPTVAQDGSNSFLHWLYLRRHTRGRLPHSKLSVTKTARPT